MAKDLRDLPAVIHPIQAAVDGADPEGTRVVFVEFRNLTAAERVRVSRVMAVVQEDAASGVPTIEPSLGAHPDPSRTVRAESGDVIIDHRARVGGIMPQPGDPAQSRIQEV